MKSKKILENLLHSVNAPFSEYKDTYNKMCNAANPVRVNLNEDSQEATIVENALIRAGLSGELDADLVLKLLIVADKVSVYKGELLVAGKGKKAVYTFLDEEIRI